MADTIEYEPQAPDLLREETLVSRPVVNGLEDAVEDLSITLREKRYRDDKLGQAALYGHISAALLEVRTRLDGIETQAYNNFKARRDT